MIKEGCALHLSDTHIVEGPRFEEIGQGLDETIAIGERVKPDLWMHSGDVFQQKSSERERLLAQRWIIRAANQAPVVIVKGNHDRPLDLMIFAAAQLEHGTKFPVFVFERTDFITVGKFRLSLLPWFDKINFVAQMKRDAGGEETRIEVSQAATKLLTTLGAFAREGQEQGLISILGCHGMIAGSKVSTGQELRGITVEFSAGDFLDLPINYGALGHIHKAQAFDDRLAYAGSTYRQNIGEEEPKGIRLIEFTRTKSSKTLKTTNTFIELTTPRGIKRWKLDWTKGAARKRLVSGEIYEQFDTPDVANALVKVEYEVLAKDVHLVDREKIKELLRKHGAASIGVEGNTQHEVRVRQSEIIDAKSNWDKLAVYLDSKKHVISADEEQRLRSKVQLLEARLGGAQQSLIEPSPELEPKEELF